MQSTRDCRSESCSSTDTTDAEELSRRIYDKYFASKDQKTEPVSPLAVGGAEKKAEHLRSSPFEADGRQKSPDSIIFSPLPDLKVQGPLTAKELEPAGKPKEFGDRAPVQKTKDAPEPIYKDTAARAGAIDLVSVSAAEATKVIKAIPELFLKEGLRELNLLSTSDADKKQVYVSRDSTAFKKQNPNLTVYDSVQAAVDGAPAGSVINVLPGKSTAQYPKGEPYTEDVQVTRSDIVIKTNEKMPATFTGGFSLGDGVHDVKIMNFDFRDFSGREAAIRVEGANIHDIVVGGNYFYSATGSEAAGFYGTGANEAAAMRNVFLLGNVIGQDRDGNSLPINITAKQLEATPFNGNVKDVVAVGNLYYGTEDTPLNLGLDFIAGEKVSNGQANQARQSFAAYNYGRNIGHKDRWASGVAYIDGASQITEVLNMSEASNFCGEIGAERPKASARDNVFAGNVCASSQNFWLSVGAPVANGASVSGSRIENNIVIDANGNPSPVNIQFNSGITREEIAAKNLFYDNIGAVRKLPRHLVQLYKFYNP